jgi:hypothetical protein
LFQGYLKLDISLRQELVIIQAICGEVSQIQSFSLELVAVDAFWFWCLWRMEKNRQYLVNSAYQLCVDEISTQTKQLIVKYFITLNLDSYMNKIENSHINKCLGTILFWVNFWNKIQTHLRKFWWLFTLTQQIQN